ncbi:hypothetical protein DL767_011335 [Monosporascus sp. MG133]|nr:hypothetical protein DL767_011335 [Monosporascus sp. MG133]
MAARTASEWPPERLSQWNTNNHRTMAALGLQLQGLDDEEKAKQPASKGWFSKIYTPRVPPSNPDYSFTPRTSRTRRRKHEPSAEEDGQAWWTTPNDG